VLTLLLPQRPVTGSTMRPPNATASAVPTAAHPTLRAAGSASHRTRRECADWRNLETAVVAATAEDDSRARFLPAIRTTCERIAGLVGAALDEARSRSCSAATTRSLSGPWGTAAPRGPGAVLWLGAHGDLDGAAGDRGSMRADGEPPIGRLA
jgi:hypothetical protein